MIKDGRLKTCVFMGLESRRKSHPDRERLDAKSYRTIKK